MRSPSSVCLKRLISSVFVKTYLYITYSAIFSAVWWLAVSRRLSTIRQSCFRNGVEFVANHLTIKSNAILELPVIMKIILALPSKSKDTIFWL